MTIHAPLTGQAGGYTNLTETAKRQLERLGFAPPNINLLMSVPQDNVNALTQLTMWETTRLLPLQVGILNTRRLIIVPNAEDARNFRDSGVTVPIKVCPLYCSGNFAPYPAMRPFRFVHVGVEHGIPSRKRHQDIIAAFKYAFPTQGDVQLIIKRHKHCSPIANFDSRITLIDEPLSDKELHALYSNCHVGIFPGGMESWGLPIAELAATGRASILPLYRGPAEFLTPASCFALPYEMVRAPREAFRESGEVANVSMDGIIAAMVFAYNNPLEVYKRGLAALECARAFSPERFGETLQGILYDYACKSGKYVVACGKADKSSGPHSQPAGAPNHGQHSDAAYPGVRDQPDAVGR